MEKKNSKSRDDARRQYNQTVQRLVDLVKRFDPRYKAAKEERAKEQARMEEERRKRQEEEKRKRFFAEIRQVIERLGGELSIYDTLDLQLARRP